MVAFDVVDEWAAGAEFRGCPFVNMSLEHPAPDHPVHLAAQRYKAEQQALFLDLARRAGLTDPQRFAAHYMLLVEAAVAMSCVSGSREPIRHARAAAAALIEKRKGEFNLGCTATEGGQGELANSTGDRPCVILESSTRLPPADTAPMKTVPAQRPALREAARLLLGSTRRAGCRPATDSPGKARICVPPAPRQKRNSNPTKPAV